MMELGEQEIKWLIKEFVSLSDYHVVERQKNSLVSMINMALNHSLIDKELSVIQLNKCKDIIDILIGDLKKAIEEKKIRETKTNQPIQEELPNVKNEATNGNP